MSRLKEVRAEIKRIWESLPGWVKFCLSALVGALASGLIYLIAGSPLILTGGGFPALLEAIREDATPFTIAGTIGATLGIISFSQYALSMSTKKWAWIGFIVIELIYWFGTSKSTEEFITQILYTPTPVTCPFDECPPLHQHIPLTLPIHPVQSVLLVKSQKMKMD